MEKYVKFCKDKGINPCFATSINAYDKARGFDPIKNIIKKSQKQGGGVCAGL